MTSPPNPQVTNLETLDALDAPYSLQRGELAPATGVAPAQEAAIEQEATDVAPDEEPVVTGTLFLTLLFLMMIFGFWATIYILLLNR